MPQLGHDLFLLMLTLSQLRDPQQVLGVYLGAVNRWSSKCSFKWVQANQKPDDHAPETIEISTPLKRFGWLQVQGDLDTLPEDFLPLVRNSSVMLGMILEKIDLQHMLSIEKSELEDLVRMRTLELQTSNQRLRAEIEEHHETMRALEESEQRYRTYIDHSPLAIFVADRQGRYVEVNDAACTLTGYSRSELLSMSIPQLADERTAEAGRAHFGQLLEQGRALGQVLLRHKTGDSRWVTVDAVRLGQDRFIAFCSDISALLAAEEEKDNLSAQLLQAQKLEAIGRLAGGIAHDFNNLLTGISGHISLTLMDLAPSDPLHATLTEMQDATTRASRLTRQLLAFSRSQIIEPKIITINRLLEELSRLLGRLLGEDIEVVWKLDNAIWPIRVDAGQLEQVVINLCVNARDAMPDGGRLLIETHNRHLLPEDVRAFPNAKPGDYVVLTVTDTGIGMDRETRIHIFEPFFTTKSKDHGTGLGLATSYGIIRQHDGFIDVESEPGHGSIFRILLPRCDGDEHTTVRLAGFNDLPQGRETILVVEDEAIVRKMAVKILSRLGYRVLSASNGGEAMRIAESEKGAIDLLMTDVIMPNMNGKQLAESLTAMHREAKVLFTSGYTQNIIAKHGILEEGLHFLAKPYTPQILAQQIDSLLHGSLRDKT